MLTGNHEQSAGRAPAVSERPSKTSETTASGVLPSAVRRRLESALRVEWLGQTAASLCWIASVFTYGISSAGDWLQLCAASAWLVANIASIATAEAD